MRRSTATAPKPNTAGRPAPPPTASGPERSCRRVLLSGVLAMAVMVAGGCNDGAEHAATTSTTAAPPPAPWRTFGFDVANSRHNPTEVDVTRDTVGSLVAAWDLSLPSGVSGSPAVVDGIAYVGDWDGVLHALDVDTGVERWTTQLEGGAVMSSVTVDGDDLFVTTSQRLYRVDRASGDIGWEAAVSDNPMAITPASPVVAGDLVLQGAASGELMAALEQYAFRGSVAAFDRASGDERWRVWLTAGDDTSGHGVGVWSTPSVDEERGLAFVGTGNTYEPPASTLADSLVAIDLATGEIAWSRQFTYPDVWSMGHSDAGGVDGDVGAGPNLWSADGRDLVGAGDKVGAYHALDRDTGEVVWETPMTRGSMLGGVIGTSAVADGRIFVGSNVGTEDNLPSGTAEVLALDDASGKILWRTPVDGAIYASITSVPGVVLTGTTEGVMLALDAATGAVLWSNQAPDQVGAAPTVVDGTVLWGYGFALSLGSVSKGSGGLVAFRPGAGEPGAGNDGGGGGSTPDGGSTGDGDDAADGGLGGEVYRRSCAACHGLRGQGGVGPSLVGVADRLSRDDHEALVRAGSPGTQMPAFGDALTDAEIDAVVEHERAAFTP